MRCSILIKRCTTLGLMFEKEIVGAANLLVCDFPNDVGWTKAIKTEVYDSTLPPAYICMR